MEAIGQATDGGDGISWRRVARREAAGRQRGAGDAESVTAAKAEAVGRQR